MDPQLRLHQLCASVDYVFVIVSIDLGDDVEVDPRSSLEFVGDDVPTPTDFPIGGAYALGASANCTFFIVSTDLGDDVEVKPRSSPKFAGDDLDRFSN